MYTVVVVVGVGCTVTAVVLGIKDWTKLGTQLPPKGIEVLVVHDQPELQQKRRRLWSFAIAVVLAVISRKQMLLSGAAYEGLGGGAGGIRVQGCCPNRAEGRKTWPARKCCRCHCRNWCCTS